MIQQNIEFFNKIQTTNGKITKLSGKYGYINPKYSVNPPLAFKNPLYHLQNNGNNNNNNGESAKSSSLTPSSSEERISIDNQNLVNNNNNNVTSSSSTILNSVMDTSSLNGRRMGSNRVPRTNPMIQVR